MKKSILNALASTCLACGCTGCLWLFGESFASRDSVLNATTNYWTITPSLDLGGHKQYRAETGFPQAPWTFVGFQSTGSGEPLPMLTNIVMRSWSSPPTEYSLPANQISKLRSASGGEVRLVIYDEGIGCLSPAMRACFKEKAEHLRHDDPERRQAWRDKKDEILRWTREVLGNEGGPSR